MAEPKITETEIEQRLKLQGNLSGPFFVIAPPEELCGFIEPEFQYLRNVESAVLNTENIFAKPSSPAAVAFDDGCGLFVNRTLI